MNTIYKIMLENSLIERFAKTLDKAELLTEHEKKFLLTEIEAIIDNETGKVK